MVPHILVGALQGHGHVNINQVIYNFVVLERQQKTSSVLIKKAVYILVCCKWHSKRRKYIYEFKKVLLFCVVNDIRHYMRKCTNKKKFFDVLFKKKKQEIT